MVILRSQNKITDFLMILAWASPFNLNVYSNGLAICHGFQNITHIKNKVNNGLMYAIFNLIKFKIFRSYFVL